MKIAFIRKRYVHYGGAEGFTKGFIDRLAKEGYEAHILAHRWSEGNSGDIIFHKVPMFGGVSFLRDLSFAFFVRRICKGQRFDLIQSNEKTLYQDIYRAGDGCHIQWLRQRSEVASPFKRLSFRLNPWHLLILWMERQALKEGNYKKVIAISGKGKQEIIENYRVPDEDIRVIYNGVDLTLFNPLNKDKYRSQIRREFGVDEDRLVILFVGSGFERKGLRCLIESLGLLRDINLEVWVVGKGKARPYQRMARALRVGDRVRFLGTVRDIYRYYAAADIFVLPSIYEPFGNVYLEALASGLPVITTRAAGAAEIIEEGVNGFVLDDPADYPGLSEKIRLLSDPDNRRKMGWEARRLAESFSFQRNINETIDLYRQVIKIKTETKNGTQK